MEGIVSSVKHSGSNTYSIVCIENGRVRGSELKGGLELRLGELVEVNGDQALPITKEPGIFIESLNDSIGKELKGLMKAEPYKRGSEEIDRSTARMWGKISSAASLMLRKLMLGSPVIIRFHNDADGSSGALGLHIAIEDVEKEISMRPNIVWLMHKGVSYSKEDAESDILIANYYSSIEKPLLVLIDFGTSLESNDGIDSIRDRFEVIWLDHHPIENGFKGVEFENYINPWLFESDSNYSAGLLACVFSRSFSSVETREMEDASLIGDYSGFAPRDGKGRELSTILDLLTSDPRIISKSNSNLTPSDIENVLLDPKKRRELYNYAMMRLDEMMGLALSSVKITRAGEFGIFVLDYEELRNDESRYPLPGRFASKLLERIEEREGRPCVLIVHFGSYISARVSSSIGDQVKLPEIINKIKSSYPNAVNGGGGHKNAGSIKLGAIEEKRMVIQALSDAVRINLSEVASAQ